MIHTVLGHDRQMLALGCNQARRKASYQGRARWSADEKGSRGCASGRAPAQPVLLNRETGIGPAKITLCFCCCCDSSPVEFLVVRGAGGLWASYVSRPAFPCCPAARQRPAPPRPGGPGMESQSGHQYDRLLSLLGSVQ